MGTVLQRIAAYLIYGGTFKLRPYEVECLKAWSSGLSDQGRDIFQRQIVFLDRYKRLKGGKLLFLFPTGWPNGQPLPEAVRFPLREDESRVARLRLRFSSTSRLTTTATIVLQHGQLTSVEFSRVPPRECWRHAEVLEVVSLREILASAVTSTGAESGKVPSNLSWLAAVSDEIECSPPRSEREIMDFLSSFQTRFPLDYEALLRSTNGISVGPLTVYGVGDAWTIPRPDGPFVSIAHIRDVGAIAAKTEGNTSALYLLDSESDKTTLLPSSFVEALRQCLSG